MPSPFDAGSPRSGKYCRQTFWAAVLPTEEPSLLSPQKSWSSHTWTRAHLATALWSLLATSFEL